MSIEDKTIFVGPQEIAGFLSRIAQALADEGATVIAFKQTHTQQQPERIKHPKIHWLFPNTIEKISSSHSFIRSVGKFIVKVFALFTAIAKADACLFIGGKGFFNSPIDYYILRLFGIRVVHMFVGTASRPRYLSAYAKQVLDSDKDTAKRFTLNLIKRTRRQRARVDAISKAANFVIENPLCGHFQTRQFVNYFQIGMPITMQSNRVGPTPQKKDSRVRILHCPSRPEIKGTKRIKEVLSPQVLERLNAELIVLTGIPHSRVLEEIDKCDFVVDQLYSDAPLAGFAAEAASFQKVPIVGGYGWDEIGQTMNVVDIPPTKLCHPDNLLKAVEELCEEIIERKELTANLEKFLTEGQWSGKEFAHKLGCVLTGDIPHDWFVDPQAISYKQGVGLSEKHAIEIARRMIELGGIKSLQLDDKPELEASYRNWIKR
jgi:hypothetical protein